MQLLDQEKSSTLLMRCLVGSDARHDRKYCDWFRVHTRIFAVFVARRIYGPSCTVPAFASPLNLVRSFVSLVCVFSHLAIRRKASIDTSVNFLPHVNLRTVLAQLRQLQVTEFRQTRPEQPQNTNFPHRMGMKCARCWLVLPYPMSQCVTSCRVISHVSLIIFCAYSL
jgi:hypothetical protein